MLAVGSDDEVVDVYSVRDSFKNIGYCKNLNAKPLHMDWSADSKYMKVHVIPES
jgi:hypothetical protein